jgi:two-component system response regulator DevR
MSQNIRLLVVDDHAVVRVGLVAWLETVPNLSVVGQAGTVAAAVSEARRCKPDVVLLDVRLPDGSGIDACQQIRSERPETRVVVLTSYGDEEVVVAAVLAGAAGYLLKESEPDRVIKAIEAAARGELLLGPDSTEAVRAWMRRLSAGRVAGPLDRLTTQERQVLALVAEGRTNAEIAATLSLSPSTIKGYVSSVLRKLQLSRRAEAAAYLVRQARASDR